MKYISVITATLSLLSLSAQADTPEPYHVFQFDLPGGYYDEDIHDPGERLLSGQTLKGDIIIEECRITEEWLGGVRFQLYDKVVEQSMMVSLMCSREQPVYLDNDWVIIQKSGDNEGVIDGKSWRDGHLIGTRIPFTIKLSGNQLTLAYGSHVQTHQLSVSPDEVFFMAFAARGEIRFFDPIESVS